MKKKVLSVLLATAMVASLAACNNSNDPSAASNNSGNQQESQAADGTYELHDLRLVVDGTLAVTTDNGQDVWVEQLNAALTERMGYDVTVKIEQYDHSGYVDAVGRMMVSGDFPDAMIMPASMFKQYQTVEGLLWDMSDAYENAEFQSRITLPAINENLKDSQGHLYGFTPAYGNGCVTYVKKAWLDNVNIDINDVTDWDSYYNMLLAFAQGDPDGDGVNGNTYGVIAAGFVKADEAPYINYMPEWWQDAYPAIYQKDGVWIDGAAEDNVKEALTRLRQGYVDRVIDPDTENASTSTAREKWFSNNQTGSQGVFTYWAGTWYNTLTNNLVKNEVDAELVMLPPIKEITDGFGGYLNRESPVWVIFDDGDGDNSREQAVFELLCDAMLDGDRVQTLWTYGAEDIHWSIHEEAFTTNPGTDNAKDYSYEEGQFHLKQSPNDPNSVWSKNYIDNAFVISPLTNGYSSASELAAIGNQFFTENCVDAPSAPSSETLTANSGNILDAVNKMVADVVVSGVDVDTAMETYKNSVSSYMPQILEELNATE